MGRKVQLTLFNNTPYEWHLASSHAFAIPKWCSGVFPQVIHPHSFIDNAYNGLDVSLDLKSGHCEGIVTYTLKSCLPEDDLRESIIAQQNIDPVDESIEEYSFSIVIIGNKTDRYWIHVDWSNLPLVDSVFPQSILSDSHSTPPRELIAINALKAKAELGSDKGWDKGLVFQQHFESPHKHKSSLLKDGAQPSLTFPSSPLLTSPFIPQLSHPSPTTKTANSTPRPSTTTTTTAQPTSTPPISTDSMTRSPSTFDSVRKSASQICSNTRTYSHPKSVLNNFVFSPNVFSTKLSKSRPQVIPIALNMFAQPVKEGVNRTSTSQLAPQLAPQPVLAVDAVRLQDFCFVATPSPYMAVSNWMEYYYPLLQNMALNQICMLGSHDSMMYTTTIHTKLGKDRYTCTQDLTFYQQLLAGSRLFDIRPSAIKKSSSKYKKEMKKYDADMLVYTAQLQTQDATERSGKNDPVDDTASPLPMPLPKKPHKHDYYSGHFAKNSTFGATGASIPELVTELNAFLAQHNELIVLSISHDKSVSSKLDAKGQRRFSNEQWEELYELLSGVENQFLPDWDRVEGFKYNPTGAPMPSNLTTSTPLSSVVLSPSSQKTTLKAKQSKFSPQLTQSPLPGIQADHVLPVPINATTVDCSQLPLSFFLLNQGWNSTKPCSPKRNICEVDQSNAKPEDLAVAPPIIITTGTSGSPRLPIITTTATPSSPLLQACVLMLYKPTDRPDPPPTLAIYPRSIFKVYNHYSNTQSLHKIGPDQFYKLLHLKRTPYSSYKYTTPPFTSISWTHTPKTSKIISGFLNIYDLRTLARIFNEQLNSLIPFLHHTNSTKQLTEVHVAQPTRGKFSKDEWKQHLAKAKLRPAASADSGQKDSLPTEKPAQDGSTTEKTDCEEVVSEVDDIEDSGSDGDEGDTAVVLPIPATPLTPFEEKVLKARYLHNDVFPNVVYVDTIHSHLMWYVMHVNMCRYLRFAYNLNLDEYQDRIFYKGKTASAIVNSPAPSTDISGPIVSETPSPTSLPSSSDNLEATTTSTPLTQDLDQTAETAEPGEVESTEGVQPGDDAADSNLTPSFNNDTGEGEQLPEVEITNDESESNPTVSTVVDTAEDPIKPEDSMISENRAEISIVEIDEKLYPQAFTQSVDAKANKELEKERKKEAKLAKKALFKAPHVEPSPPPIITTPEPPRSEVEQDQFDFCSVSRAAAHSQISHSSFSLIDDDDWN